MIDSQRLTDIFLTLVKIDSPSREEKQISEKIAAMAVELGAEVETDNSQAGTGSNADNLIIRWPGDPRIPPLLLCAHMDTVQPGNGVKPRFENGVFTSDGTTILGADDKSAIAVIFEALHTIKDKKGDVGPLEILFTTCEEIGLVGAKHLDYSLIRSKYGFVLDTSGTEGIVTRAPAANHIEFVIHGRDAHAGVCPEKGINAIQIAAQAIAGLQIGRIDPETTCNIGLIEGGVATNIVPKLVKVKGEIRSHDQKKLEQVTETIKNAFEKAVESFRQSDPDNLPRLDTTIESDFPLTHVPDDHPVVKLAKEAARNLGRTMETRISGGGADANIFFSHGIVTAVLGTGMRDMHTVNESIRLEDMTATAELLLEILRLHAAG